MLKKIVLILGLAFITDQAYGLNLDRAKIYFLSGDYASCIKEGEKILAGSGYSQDLDELYYLLGLSYLKEGNFLRACDIFEIILSEFKESKFRDEARLSLGDTYFLRADFSKAEDYYQELIKNNPHTKLKAQLYYRLSQTGFKKGDIEQGKQYSEKLKQEFPSNAELISHKDMYSILQPSLDFYYTVQVGSFSNITNAKNLTQRLIQKGYPAFNEEISYKGKQSYRVRIGKLRTRKEAEILERKLSQEGYPTKIYP